MISSVISEINRWYIVPTNFLNSLDYSISELTEKLTEMNESTSKFDKFEIQHNLNQNKRHVFSHAYMHF